MIAALRRIQLDLGRFQQCIHFGILEARTIAESNARLESRGKIETMHADDRIELGTSFKRIKPSVPILFLYKMNGFRVPPGIADEQVEFLGGPKLLLQALNRLLSDGQNQRDDD